MCGGGGGVGDGGGSGGDCCCLGLTQVWLGCEGRWREGTTQWLDRLLQHPSPDSLHQSPLPFKMLINLPTLSRRFDLSTSNNNNNKNNQGSIEGGRRVAEGGLSLENSRAKRAQTLQTKSRTSSFSILLHTTNPRKPPRQCDAVCHQHYRVASWAPLNLQHNDGQGKQHHLLLLAPVPPSSAQINVPPAQNVRGTTRLFDLFP